MKQLFAKLAQKARYAHSIYIPVLPFRLGNRRPTVLVLFQTQSLCWSPPPEQQFMHFCALFTYTCTAVIVEQRELNYMRTWIDAVRAQ